MQVQKLRLQRGWSQEQLATVTGLSVRTIQRIERGQPASLESQKALAAVFEIDLAQLQEPAMSTPATNTPATNAAEAEEALAFAHVRRVKRFYFHVIQYVVCIGTLVVINLLTTRFPWAIFPTLGWGVGQLAHGLAVFNKIPFLGADWEKQQAEKFLGRKF